MKNLLLENVEYKIETTNLGVWRRYLYPTGAYFAEFKLQVCNRRNRHRTDCLWQICISPSWLW